MGIYIADYDQELLKTFMRIFSTSPLTALLRGYFAYMGIPLSDDEDEDQKAPPAAEEDPYDMILVG